MKNVIMSQWRKTKKGFVYVDSKRKSEEAHKQIGNWKRDAIRSFAQKMLK